MRALTRRHGGAEAGPDSAGEEPARAASESGRGRGKRRKDSKPARPAGGKRKHTILGNHPVLSVLAIIVTALVTGVTLTAYVYVRNVYDSIHHIDVSGADLGSHRPPKLNNSTNILLIGSDSRIGTHHLGYVQGARSDTAMLLHISPVSRRAIVISFPRDSVVPVLSCPRMDKMHPGQPAAPRSLEQLNATYSFGGPACLWRTIEQTTRIHIDHFVQVDFYSFKKIVNDVGGVPVCLPKAITDHASHLHLKAGYQVVRGGQALAFVRLRHIGDGSDIQRIMRQQYFLASAAQRIKSEGVLSNPRRFYNTLHDVANAITTDNGMSFDNMLAIANTMKGISTGSLRFITVPWTTYPLNTNWVTWLQDPQAHRLFNAIRHDKERAAVRAGRAGRSATSAPTVSPATVNVTVDNGSNTAGLAATTAQALQAKGFHVTGKGNAPVTAHSVIEYGSASQQAAVAALQAEIPGAQAKQVSGLAPSTLTLVLGTSFQGLNKTSPSPGSSTGPKIGKSYGGITGNTNICKDTGAFAGPDTPSQFGP
jgi:LCP family protein required for cell wall assembly